MSKAEFVEIAERDWIPVVLTKSAQPEWMRGIPDERVAMVLASGSFADPRMIQLEGNTQQRVVGGMDVYRYDETDLPIGFPFNKDHYIVVQQLVRDEYLLVVGPVKDDDHWLAELPDIDPNLEILEFSGAVLEEGNNK